MKIDNFKESFLDETNKDIEEKKLKITKTLTPTALISVWINEDGEIEESNLIEEFEGGDYGKRLKDNSDEYDSYILESAGIYSKCTEKNSLYHLYINIEYYKYGYYEPEWDIELTILNTILVQQNYVEFLDSEDKYSEKCKLEEIEWEEQRELRAKDRDIIEIMASDCDDGWNWENFKLHVTFNEVENLVKNIATFDIKLAHRILINRKSYLEEFLGDLYDENIVKVEGKRLELKEYIKKTREFRYTRYGYEATLNSKGYYGKKVDVSFEDINNLSDEDLLIKNPEELLVQLYYAPEIMNKLMDGIEESEETV